MGPTVARLAIRRRKRRMAKSPCLSELIAAHLERRGWTCSKFAEVSGIDGAIVSRILNFKQAALSEQNADKLRKALKCSLARIHAARRCSWHLMTSATRSVKPLTEAP